MLSSAKNTDQSNDLRETANQAGRKVRSLLNSANVELTQAAETVTTRINEKPVQSTLIALGAGLLLGALLRRR